MARGGAPLPLRQARGSGNLGKIEITSLMPPQWTTGEAAALPPTPPGTAPGMPVGIRPMQFHRRGVLLQVPS